MGTWKATPVEDKVITKEDGGFAYKLTFTPEDTVNYSEAVVENLMIYIHFKQFFNLLMKAWQKMKNRLKRYLP